MLGIDRLIAMRMRGIRPAAVWVDDIAEHKSYGIRPGDSVHIILDEHECPEKADFRAVVGLEVHCQGARSLERTKRLYGALKQSGAALVVAVHCERINEYLWDATWADVWRKEIDG